jgi:hypothetical protein
MNRLGVGIRLVIAAFMTAFLFLLWLIHLASMPGARFPIPQSIMARLLYVLLGSIVLTFVFRATANVAGRFFNRAVVSAVIAYVGCYFLLILVCALLYAQINTWENGRAFNNNPTLGDLLYFSATTASTLGYGDYAPQTGYVKAIAVIEATISIVLIGVYLGFIAGLLSQSSSNSASSHPRSAE